jgi:hypothetical protein
MMLKAKQSFKQTVCSCTSYSYWCAYKIPVVQVRAAGALIKFLEKQRVGIELEDATAKIPVLTVRLFTL